MPVTLPVNATRRSSVRLATPVPQPMSSTDRASSILMRSRYSVSIPSKSGCLPLASRRVTRASRTVLSSLSVLPSGSAGLIRNPSGRRTPRVTRAGRRDPSVQTKVRQLSLDHGRHYVVPDLLLEPESSLLNGDDLQVVTRH